MCPFALPPISLPIRRIAPFSPPDFYAALREHEPVKRVTLPNGRTAWLIARHADVRAALKNPHLSADPRRPGFPEPEESARPTLLIEMDPPEHTVVRRMLAAEFSPQRLAQLRAKIEADADRLIAEMKARGNAADLVPAFTVPIPLLTICHLLGVPYADRALFQSAVAASLSLDVGAKAAAFGEIYAYLQRLVAAKIEEPGDDLLGRLVIEQVRPGHLDEQGLAGIAVILLMAGFETTATMIALGIATLFHHPGQLARFRAEPALTDSAVEEMLRYHSIGDADALRVAIADTEIGGRRIAAGEGVIPLLWSANRDPDAFAEPDRFDIARDAAGQLAFGYGIHQCLGLNLARLEMRVALRRLFDRLPALRLTMPAEALPFRYEAEIFGVEALPAAW